MDIRKLTDYCLSSNHPVGKHKARVFESALGLMAEDAPLLCEVLLQAVSEEDANLGESDDYGRRFTVDFAMRTDIGEAKVRSGWMIRNGEDFPRLTTCFVL
ncbi:MAG: hypothetical protein Q9P44_02190 [Anaerolineae bacterium]|nr:hypothetical protein [Anaerolineae bacterium]